jgi:hypothetical protein
MITNNNKVKREYNLLQTIERIGAEYTVEDGVKYVHEIHTPKDAATILAMIKKHDDVEYIPPTEDHDKPEWIIYINEI